jgi:hypothetical protein
MHPIVNRQWETLTPLKATIIENTTLYIRSAILEKDDIFKALSALVVLNAVQTKPICEYFLDQRKIHISQMLTHGSGNSVLEITNQLTRLSTYIHNTFLMVYELFYYISGDKCYFQRCLQALQEQKPANHSTTIPKLYPEKGNIHVLLRHLPSEIRYFAPLIKPLPEITNQNLCKIIMNWVTEIEKIFETAEILNSIDDGISISQIYDNLFRSIQDKEGSVATVETQWVYVFKLKLII